MARSQGAPAPLLVRESATALGAFRDDPAGLVAACRRIVDRQLTCAPLWWLCARILCAPDPMAEAGAAVVELQDDPTARHLSGALPTDATVVAVGWPEQAMEALTRRGDVEVLVVDSDGEARAVVHHLEQAGNDAVEVPARNLGAALEQADLLLLDALAVGPRAALVPAGSRPAAAAAARAGTPVWLSAGVGRLLPARMWEALLGRWEAAVDPLEAAEEALPLDLVDRVAGVAGVVAPAEALTRTDCPVAPELFRLVG